MTFGNLDVVNTVAQVGLCVATIGLFYVAYYQVNKIREQSNADFIARLNREFFYENETNPSVIRAIEENRPIFKKNGGEFTEYELHAYLRYFEMIERFIAGDIISLDLVDEMFGNYIARSWENKEIRKYVTDIRINKNDRRYFEHFEQLAKKILTIEKSYHS